jgi:uncharacterized small protein (DUF1192 family)
MSEEVMAADALMRANADLSRQIGELNTTIGYQDAMLARFEAELTATRAAAQLAANTLFTLSYRADLDENTRAAIKQVQLRLDSALHDPLDVTAQRPKEPATSQKRDQPAVTAPGADTAGETQV